MKSKSPADILG